MRNQIYRFQTAKEILELKIIDVIEPNNGRMLNVVLLYLNGVNVTGQYFNFQNYINFDLEKYMPQSLDKKWIYIPKENDHFLINTQNLEIISLPSLMFSATSFIGNYFFGNYLIVLSYQEIIQKNLATQTTKVLKQIDKQLFFKDLNILDEKAMQITLSNGQAILIDVDLLKML
jgi:hypothetical protein